MKDISEYIRAGKLLVVELDDGVEHVIADEGVADLKAGKEIVRTTRLVDLAPQRVSARRITWALSKDGTTDYIDPPRPL